MHLLAIGDSIIDGAGAKIMEETLPVQFARALSGAKQRQVNWRVEGQSGLDITGLLQRLDSLEAGAADVVLISIGVNDVTGLSSTRHWRRSVACLLDRLQCEWPDARIIFAGLPPMSQFPLPPQPLRATLGWRAAKLDSIAAELCARGPNVIHVPTKIDPQLHTFCEDGFHPSTESYQTWAKELVRAILAS
jgi:lysophospholipase L1-like esterase